ncbi:MAG TPA: glycosyltransferase family 2 protein [Terriglobales bacterium]|nr:glycosyltransferase family 2 protein [Terriglobales bacterium]
MVPKVSVGLPVYNGAAYLHKALDSILGQTVSDLEIVISDNASSDETERICRAYAARDPRVRYFRNPVNRGVGWNYNRVARLARGEFFLWVAHDDLLAPEYIRGCVQELERDSSAVLCCSNEIVVNEGGEEVGRQQQIDFSGSGSPHERFRQMIDMRHNCDAIYGVMRRDVLRRTAMHGDFADSDRCLLAELALHGRFARLPDYLFLHREHEERVTRKYPTRQLRNAVESGQGARFMFPHFRQLREYAAAIHRAPLSWGEKQRCYAQLPSWVFSNALRLGNDLRFVAIQAVRPILRMRYN